MSDTVDKWLNDLGLGQYTKAFAENDIDDRALPLLTNEDLKELGVSLGHRKIMIAALQLPERPSPDTTAADPPVTPAVPHHPAHSPHVKQGSDRVDTTPDQRASAAERRHLTVLFADLVGSTELTNRLDPEDMRNLLQNYQDAVAGAISRYGGYVAKYLGDGLLIFFGWPQAYEDHAIRAAKAGLDATRRVKGLVAPDGTPLEVRIGIASGQVVVGDTIGQNTYEEGAMTGPILNLAARIQEHAPGNSVIITAEETQTALSGMFDLETLGPITIKGFDTPRTLMRIAAERSAQSRFHAVHQSGPDSTMIRRELEKGILRQAWRQAHDGKGEVVMLAGEAGIGKSKLTEDFLSDDVLADDADIIRLNCSPYLTSSPFHPVVERISQDAGVHADDDDERLLEQVRALLETRAGLDLEQVLPVYAALVAPGSQIAQQVLAMSPPEQRDLTIQTLVDVIKTRSTRHPVLLLVEDAHWIDPSTSALLDRIAAICTDLSMMVLITHRPGWQMDWSNGDTHVQTLQLRRFTPEQVGNLVATIAGRSLEPRLISEIIEKTDGVPLFIEEVTRALITTGEQEPLSVPSSLQGALMARLDAVSEQAKQVALTAAVIGREFEPSLLRAAMEINAADSRKCLEELQKSGLMFESGHNRGHYVFRHALIHDTAYQSMLSSTRRERHAKVARALMMLRSAEINRRPELVARHLTEAADFDAAFDRWKSATQKALARSASHEAVANAAETLDAAQKLDTPDSPTVIRAQILVGQSYESAGRLPEALSILETAIASARNINDTDLMADAAFSYIEATMLVGERHDLAVKHCQEALDRLPVGDEARRCSLMGQMARGHMSIGNFAQSAEFSRKSLALAERLGDVKAQFAVMMSRFAAPLIAREPDEIRNWRDNLDAMQSVANRLGSIDQGRDRTLDLFISAEMGDRQRMNKSLQLLSEIALQDKHPQLYWVKTHAQAMAAILDGDFAGAEAFANEAVKIGRLTHGEHVEGVFGVQMFTIRREQGRLQEIAPVMKRLIDETPDDDTWRPGFAVIAAELGYNDAAERILNEMAQNGFSLSPDAVYSTTLSYLAEVCVAVRNREHAETIYGMLAPYENMTITAGATTVCGGAAARRLGSLAALLESWDLAQDMFETAIQIDTGMNSTPWIAHSKAEYAAALRQRGRRADAERSILLEAEALEISQKLGMLALRSKLEGRMN